MVTLKDIGEHKLLEIINQYCDRDKNGDDGAILDLTQGEKLIVTTDVLVENIHFSHRTTPPESIGYRAVTANLSDIAAMGGLPLGITVGLSLTPDVDIDWIEAIYRGMQQCLKPYNVNIVGGDITKSATNTIAITALGEVKPQKIIYRHTAQVGDLILITGKHGLSKAGLEILLQPDKYSQINSQTKEKVIFAHQYPLPRLDVIKQISEYFPNAVITGMDSSDGLADAIIQICQKSNVGATINLEQITIATELTQITNQDTALEWALYGGEDFELVLCLSPTIADKILKLLGKDSQIIGEIKALKTVQIINRQNKQPKVLLNQQKTYQHF